MRDAVPNRFLSFATVAMTPDLDPEVSRERLAQLVRQIKSEHADVRLILFGETILGWFYKKGETAAYHQRIAETIPGPSTELVGRLARDHDVYISFGLTERQDGKLHNTQVLVDPNGEIAAVHRKFWIRNRVFTPGDRKLTIAEIDGVMAAILICADARSLWLLRAIRRARPDVVLASLADYGTNLRLNQMMGTFFDTWTVVANRYGEEPPLTWRGLLTITDPVARLRAHEMGKEQYLCQRIRIARPGLVHRKLRRLFVAGKLLILGVFYVCEWGMKKLRGRCSGIA
jgi:predicted amidohydrolase